MLTKLKDKQAQATTSEYLLVLGIVVTAMITMTVYARRAIQAKIRDADLAMTATAINRTGNHFKGNWYLYYEPYYFNTSATTTRNDSLRSQLNKTTFVRIYNTFTSVDSDGDTASPRGYLNNIPTNGYTSATKRALP